MTVGELYREYEPSLNRFARRLCRDKDEADDLVQDTFLRAMGNRMLLEGLHPSKRRAWLYRTMKNLFIDRERNRQREAALREELQQHLVTHADPVVLMSLPELFNRIPVQYRDLLHRRYVQGMTGDQIAAELGIPPATVRSRLHLALIKLRAQKARFF